MIDDVTSDRSETAQEQPAPDSHLLPGEKVDFKKPRKASRKQASKKAAKKDTVPTAKGPKLPRTVKPKKAAKPKAKREREPRAARGLTKASKRDAQQAIARVTIPKRRRPGKAQRPKVSDPREAVKAPRLARGRGRQPLWPTDIQKLQAMYHTEVGRPISSTSRRYLIMQLRRTRAGNPPTGRVGRKLGENPKVIPLRFPSEAVEALDAFLGKSMTRAEFFTRAAAAALKKAGETTIAAFFV